MLELTSDLCCIHTPLHRWLYILVLRHLILQNSDFNPPVRHSSPVRGDLLDSGLTAHFPRKINLNLFCFYSVTQPAEFPLSTTYRHKLDCETTAGQSGKNSEERRNIKRNG